MNDELYTFLGILNNIPLTVTQTLEYIRQYERLGYLINTDFYLRAKAKTFL